jgi:predicted AlkP superfamily phosphohydrolase/phosphomutase
VSDLPTGRVLAIGLDATESTLIRRMIDTGELPTMKSLLDRGTWRRVTSPTMFSSGAVWPNFSTGCQACDHGQYSIWNWDPAAMELAYTDESRLVPFWKALAEDGATVGTIDIPFSPLLGLQTGFEVHEWGAHSRVDGRVSASPAGVAATVSNDFAPHPFANPLATVPSEPSHVGPFLDECIAGVRLRGDLAHRLISTERPDLTLVVFEEPHHAGHFVWHTVEPELPMYADLPPSALPERTLADLYRELDRQVGRLVDAAGPETTVVVFALHGMAPSRGLPDVLDPVLARLGMTHLREGDGPSTLTRLKDRMPAPLRDLYRRLVPQAKRAQWGKARLLPTYDWSRTRAFALPIEQYGLVRINLAGREAQGIVPVEEYEQTCETIEAALRELSTADGRKVVQDVVRPPRGSHAAGLPDLVVHWSHAAFESPAQIDGVTIPNIRREQTGEHAWDGFCIASGPAAAALPADEIDGRDLHRFLTGAMGR